MLDNGIEDKSLIYKTFDYAFTNDPNVLLTQSH